MGSVPGLGRYPGERPGNPLQYSYLEDPMGRGAWRALIHRVAQSWTQLSDFHYSLTIIRVVENDHQAVRNYEVHIFKE